MALVFVSYRRIDSAAAAGRIYDRLTKEFGRKRVFMDVEGGIAQGADFPTEIARALTAASAVLVVIGRQWMTCTDAAGAPRISINDDWVANEVASALDRNILVLPILVDGARMPPARVLPQRIAALSRKQACEIRASSWDDDFRPILATLRPVVRDREWRRRGALALIGISIVSVGVLATRAYFTPTTHMPRLQGPQSPTPHPVPPVLPPPAPALLHTHYNRGVSHMAEGRHDQAINDFSQVIMTGSPEHSLVAKAYYNRGVCYGHRGQKDNALDDLKKFLALSDDPILRPKAEANIIRLERP